MRSRKKSDSLGFEGRGQQGDRNAGGIRDDDASRFADLVHLGQRRFLYRRLFKNRLHDDIHVLKVPVAVRGRYPGQGLFFFIARKLSLLDHPIQYAAKTPLGPLGQVRGLILNQDLAPRHGKTKPDFSTHHARAQNSCFADVSHG